ncbi:STAS domain-containing protein [Rhodoblastus acidophilus]|uniref:STAS domain-containing protein n=1 Tax=Rhodoblastus acidophilus TaxID=1074 RepID=A0A6N8DPB7_RHOAC|nr:STAS domain-containing protein [Rhodoblastus acidophilus]MCW2275805.1 hypothetical protein [Rhodoblastus acidophilus]MTV32410.1 STAS domain-containing protein [Rhodoblastus acidophilus]
MQGPSLELSSSSVCFSEDITIRSIKDIWRDLLDRFAATDALNLVIDDDSFVDLSFVQLITSARQYAKDHGKTISLARPAAGTLRRVLERAGFLTDSPSDTVRFWLHEEQAR